LIVQHDTRFTACELMEMELPPVTWVVPDVLPEGVTILGGKPKMGKSWMAYGLAVAVATGGVALGTKQVERGEALYLALEDNPRRLRKRLGKVLRGEPAPEGLHIWTRLPQLDEGGVEEIEGWLVEHPDARLVVVDTLAKVRPRQRGQHLYSEDYAALERLLPLAADHGVSILVVHHLRKMDADDPLDTISGSTGLSGGVDGTLILKRDRGKADAVLFADGRDVEEPAQLALTWDRNLASWSIVGNADEYRISEARAKIIRVLEDFGSSMTPTEVADVLGEKVNNVKQNLWRMAGDGQLVSNEGRYSVTSNPGNPVTGQGEDGYPGTGVTEDGDVTDDPEEKPGTWHEHLQECRCPKCQEAIRRGLK
jgi:hypothetical protein